MVAVDKALGLWLNGRYVGAWRLQQGVHSLEYDKSWAESEEARPLSFSLPISKNHPVITGTAVANYFDNLLPNDDRIRRRIAQRYGLDSIEPFDLLSAVGRDCVGAIQVLPMNEVSDLPSAARGRTLTEHEVANLLRQVPAPLGAATPADNQYDLRLSIAGAQEKTALLFHEGVWKLPIGSTATTHILKLPMGLVGNMRADMRTSVENEWLCSEIFTALGLSVAKCEMLHFEDQKVLGVKRFDRKWIQGNTLIRLPQEDFCQVKGISPHKKYQADGGPGIEDIMHWLERSLTMREDRRAFFKAQIIFWLLAATDGHAKNFSIFLLPESSFTLAPFYDVLSAHPILGRGPGQMSPHRAKLAMGVRGTSRIHYRIFNVQFRHWVHEALVCGLQASEVKQLMDEIAGTLDAALEIVASKIPAGFPDSVARAIFDGMRAQRDALFSAR